ncbi:MAG TPA: glycosyltransferase family 9 protein [Pirellulales bacterium]|jgi:lipopolysaccharide heptosyltransferase I|nr:glycosyltransferase family 9 protein [Pirellulales bacterium]
MDLPDRRILIVRLSAIGDVVHGLPVLAALRDAQPRAFVAWIVEERAAAILRGQAELDELIVIKRGWYRSLREILAIRRRIRGYRFDTSIDLQGLTKSAGLAWISGIPQRIGFKGPSGREFSRLMNNQLVSPQRTHVIDRNVELLTALGVTDPSPRLKLEVSASDLESADRILASLAIAGGFALMNPGAGWPSKLWPAERYAGVARHLGTRRGVKSVVVWGTDRERAWAQEIVGGSQGQALAAPATSLSEMAALAKRASMFIGSDTGPLHIAAAVGTACVGLFGPMPAERNGPYGNQNIALQHMRLEGSHRQRRRATGESMQAITVSDVTAACDQILDRAVNRLSA